MTIMEISRQEYINTNRKEEDSPDREIDIIVWYDIEKKEFIKKYLFWKN